MSSDSEPLALRNEGLRHSEGLQALSHSLGFSLVEQETLLKSANDKIELELAEASDRKGKLKPVDSNAKSGVSQNGSETSDVDVEDDPEKEISEPILPSDSNNFSGFEDEGFKRNPITLRRKRKVSEPASDASYSPSQDQESSDEPFQRKLTRRGSSKNYYGSSSDESDGPPEGPKGGYQQPDDSDPILYRKRLQGWIEVRRSHRNSAIEISELEAPHPLYPDKELAEALLPGEIFKDLMGYQVAGVAWFLKLFSWRQGGVLADEMGLGKTIQAIAFLASLYYSGKLAKPSLVVCPATLTQQWVQELHRWWPPLRVINLHSGAKAGVRKKGSRMRAYVEPDFEKGVVFMASYEGFVAYGADFARMGWGCVILDEGHKISNPDTKISKATKLFETPYRYILSGTPIQNKLKELWSIYDFVRPGLLGSQEEFDKRIARSIELTGSKGEDDCDRQLAAACARVLRSVIKNNLLRRLKSDVAKELPKKSEQVVYCQLRPKQRQAYIDYLNSEQCRMILANKLNHMVGISTLRKISNHPDLIYHKCKHQVLPPNRENYGHYKASGKTRVLDGLLHLWKDQGHRVLIFCQTIQTMEIIQGMGFFDGKLLLNLRLSQDPSHQLIAMNGNTPVNKRMAMVDRFNTDDSIFAFLLTTRTGGQGLNLTGADRVVIFDPDWNPTADLQALSRAWRLGQSKEVFIYRLLAAGTIEERVHHLQLYKQVLSDRILKDPQQKLLFRNHTNDLFAPPPKLIRQVGPFESSDKKSIQEAKDALLNSKEINQQNESKGLPPADKQKMFNLLGVGTESTSQLDRDQQAMASDPMPKGNDLPPTPPNSHLPSSGSTRIQSHATKPEKRVPSLNRLYALKRARLAQSKPSE
ncbi:DNA repair protein rhp26 [Massospora cicadina]|nr:DNA repair protein rhp26 [Massospora cicadina]